MATLDPVTHSLQVRQVVSATPARAYRAWTDETLLSQWFAPSADAKTIVHQMDARPGGRYRIEMRMADGSSHVAVGEYRELHPAVRLTFSWKWEGTPMADTLVTVEFEPRGSGTEIVLTHTLFQAEAQRDQHTEGWTGCLGRIETALFD